MVHIQAAQKISDAREPYSFACYGVAHIAIAEKRIHAGPSSH